MRYVLALIMLTSIQTAAKPSPKAAKDVNTEFSFNGLNINGRYNMPSESLIRVEDEKSINNLIFIRTNFRDRIKEGFSRN